MSYKGLFVPKNPSKYLGDPTQITFRSLWERSFMVKCDETPEIIEWASEEFCISYRDPSKQNTIHRYFPDFLIKVKQKDEILTKVIEIKPYKQTQLPIKKKRVTKRYITEVNEYVRNQAKWTAAKAFCEDKGWQFVVITENELFNKQAK